MYKKAAIMVKRMLSHAMVVGGRRRIRLLTQLNVMARQRFGGVLFTLQWVQFMVSGNFGNGDTTLIQILMPASTLGQ